MFQKPSPDIALHHDEQETDSVYEEDTIETIVGPSMNVEGDFVSEGNIIIKGYVSGSIKTGKMLSIEEGARVVANIQAADAVISGLVKGNIDVRGTCEITASAQIAGDIMCATLSVEPGALLQGKIHMEGLQIEGSVKKRTTRGRSRIRQEEDTLDAGSDA